MMYQNVRHLIINSKAVSRFATRIKDKNNNLDVRRFRAFRCVFYTSRIVSSSGFRERTHRDYRSSLNIAAIDINSV